jgi:hypothetical protein
LATTRCLKARWRPSSKRSKRRLSSDGALHRVSALRASASGLAVSGELSLAADKPYALTAKVAIEGEAAGRTLAFDLAADGSLEELAIRGSGRPLDAKAGESFAGQLTARIKSFRGAAHPRTRRPAFGCRPGCVEPRCAAGGA